jgi:hypothetical protein
MTKDLIIPHFYLEDKLSFLRKLGYEIKQIDYEMSYPCYHNDVEYGNVKVWAVYYKNQEYLKPSGYNFGQEEWLDYVFCEEMQKKLRKILLN